MALVNPDYPVRLDVDRPQHLSRLLIFVKWLLVIPHLIALWFLGIGAFFAIVIAWFAVLITGRFPRGLYDYLAGVLRWNHRVFAYMLLQTDEYPPFTLEDDSNYPVRVEFEYPEHIARWRALFNWILGYPALIVAGFIELVAFLAAFAGWFAILVTGRYPEGLFDTVTVFLRWTVRVSAYMYFMTSRYPPFVWA